MSRAFDRILWIVLDSVGIGALPDAGAYDDIGSDTLGNIARRRALDLPNLRRLGLANIKPLPGLSPVRAPAGCFGKCMLASPGKDTTTGHWEMAGIILEKPFPLYPRGFPPDVIACFESRIGRKVLGNKAASGTEIIQELGDEHIRTRSPIVYTSADSVFQVAAHEEIIPPAELYRICEIARGLLQGPHEVGRVIARPFTGTSGHFVRTANRHDFAIAPPHGMLLDRLAEKAVPVMSIGKIVDIFLGRGITKAVRTKNNADGVQAILAAMNDFPEGVIWANLVDFDQQYGHRNDVEGYASALEAFDRWLACLDLQPGDLLVITADHGCDPTTPSTDHSREYTPLLVYGDHCGAGVDLGIRRTLADIGQTIAANFNAVIDAGSSFLHQVEKGN